MTPQEVAGAHPRGGCAVFTGDRGKSVEAMAAAFERWIVRQRDIGGIISAGGSGGTSLATAGMRALPLGMPKIMISTVASGDVGRYVGAADIMMMHSVADVQGLNSITEQILPNGANALAGMIARMPSAGRARGGRAAREAGPRHHHVRPDHALRAGAHGRPRGRLRLPGLPRHRHRRPLDGEPRRFTACSPARSTSRRRKSPTCSSAACSPRRRTASAPSSAAHSPMSARSARSTW